MNAYVDASVILRMVLGEPGRLKVWRAISSGVTSTLTEVEVLRTLDRLRIAQRITDRDVSTYREAAYRLLQRLTIFEVSRSLLSRASQPFPTLVGTLDAVHLSTALVCRERGDELVFATHDAELAVAARASGFKIVGA